MTSHDVVAITRRARKTREVGHAGTLDPMATGVLVVMVGEATKLASYLTAADKEYECEIALGTETDSFDADGSVVRQIAPPNDWPTRLVLAIQDELSRTSQVPPAVSAVHVDGERAHDRVRRGETVVLAPREVQVRSIDVVAVGPTSVRARLVVSKGYYVRSFARDLAAALGTVGHLVFLRRLRSGSFDLSTAVSTADLASAPLLSVAAAAASCLPVARLTDDGASLARVGKVVPDAEREPAMEGIQAWVDKSTNLVAIGEVTGGFGRVRRGFTGTP
jgi:tRNA pseudouridine55 synthase